MNLYNYLYNIKTLLKNYNSCSIVNQNCELLFSKDTNLDILSTTRLVAFQIVKKYLKPKPQDLFILNDPENGGYQFSKLIFISCLTPNLFLIWDCDNSFIDFKIPPTPLYDQGQRNDFVWNAMIDSNKYSKQLEAFFVGQKSDVDRLFKLTDMLNLLSNVKNQQNWLNSTNEIFLTQFENKAHGNSEIQYIPQKGNLIKLKFSAEEKQNIRLITLDFTNTNTATDFYCSSHVVESAIVKAIIDFYQLNDFFTQAVLDKIKIILPPKSIVSKPHPTGEFNFELQTICTQMAEHNMKFLNSNTRKSLNVFNFRNYLSFDLLSDLEHSQNFISEQMSILCKFEEFVKNQSLNLSAFSRKENCSNISFTVNSGSPMKLRIKNNYQSGKPNNFVKINNTLVAKGLYDLTKSDKVEIKWE